MGAAFRDPELLVKRIISWIQSELRRADAKGAVFGLSGGVDSAVVAALLCESRVPAMPLIMPCDSISQDMRDAMLVAETLRLSPITMDLSPIHGAFADSLEQNVVPISKMARSNLKSRLRMCAMYSVAQSQNYLVCGTGNKAEITTGYFTKYGDAACDLLPLGDLLKHEVWSIGAFLGLPKVILEKAPSAGLWAGQTDETEMGMRYVDLDRFLAGFDVPSSIKFKIEAMAASSEHKRRMPPVCVIDPE